jgi:hypothetical protein
MININLKIYIFVKVQFMVARSKAWTVFAFSNVGIVGSNPSEGMDVCVCVYSVFVLSCVQVAALRRAYNSSNESYRLCKKWLRNWRRGQGPYKTYKSNWKKNTSWKMRSFILIFEMEWLFLDNITSGKQDARCLESLYYVTVQ